MTGMANTTNAGLEGQAPIPPPPEPAPPQSSQASPLTPADPTALDQALERCSALAESGVEPPAFLESLRQELRSHDVKRLSAWVVNPDGKSFAALGNPVNHRDEATASAQEVLRSRRPDFAADGSLTVPWQAIGGSAGVLRLEYASDTSAASSRSRRLALAAAVAEIVARFQTEQGLASLRQQVNNQSRSDELPLRLHASLDLSLTARNLADEGRVWLDCDRVSVLLRHGKRWRVAAVSGAEHVHRHSPAAERLEYLAARVAATGQPLWFESEAAELPPQISEPLGEYLDASPAIALVILPLEASAPANEGQNEPPLGLLVVEQYREPLRSDQRQAIPRLVSQGSLAVANAWSVSRIPGQRFWRKLLERGYLRRWAPGVVAVAAGMLIVGVALFGITTDIRLRARGELLPAQRRDVFAPRDGVVATVLVESGDLVEEGQPLLELRSTELELETQRVEGELDLARKRLAVTRSERLQLRPGDAETRTRERRLTAEEDQYQQQVESLEQRLAMLREHQTELTVRAPLAGQVLTWNTQQRLAGRPLRRGESLLTIADIAGPWQAELKLPSRQAGRLLAQLSQLNGTEPRTGSDTGMVSFAGEGRASSMLPITVRLATDPGTWRSARLSQWSSRLLTDEAGDAYLLVTVDLDLERPGDRVPGSTAIASLGAGRGSLAEAWFHELTDAIRLWLPF